MSDKKEKQSGLSYPNSPELFEPRKPVPDLTPENVTKFDYENSPKLHPKPPAEPKAVADDEPAPDPDEPNDDDLGDGDEAAPDADTLKEILEALREEKVEDQLSPEDLRNAVRDHLEAQSCGTDDAAIDAVIEAL